MEFHQPASLSEALEMKAAHPEAVPVAGGTDIMVELNFNTQWPAGLLDLNRVTELRHWYLDDGIVHIGAGLPYCDVIAEIGDLVPALTIAARGIGSPQIRNRGTLGGNLGSASPAGDGHPPLLATNSTIELASRRGRRQIAAADFFTGVKSHAAAPDELITEVRIPVAAGPQQFAKIGPRNAMVIAVCAFAVTIDATTATVGTGIGSAAPTPIRAPQAEDFAAAELPWDSRADIPEALSRRFGELVAAAANPIADVRGTAEYRRHALSVMAHRTLGWAWKELQCA